MKTIEKLFGVSLAVISLTSLVTAVTGLIGYSLPVWALRTIGIVNLLSLPLLIYSTVKSMKEKAASARKLAKKAEGKALPVPAAAEEGDAAPAPKKVQPKPHPQQLAARKAASGKKHKKGKKPCATYCSCAASYCIIHGEGKAMSKNTILAYHTPTARKMTCTVRTHKGFCPAIRGGNEK